MSNEGTNNLNQQLFEAIKKREKHRGGDWKSTTQQLLGIGRTALYNRINGSTPLLLEEAVLLAQKYGISLDSLLLDKKFIIARHSAQAFDPKKGVEDYLHLIAEQFKMKENLVGATFYYASNDLPVFYYALAPELLAFKIFAWGIAMPHSEKQRQQKFSLQNFSRLKPEFSVIHEALREYGNYPSIEIWPAKILDNTLNQLEFYARTHRFKNLDDIQRLYQVFEELITKIFNQYITNGQKPLTEGPDKPQNLTVYYNEIIQINTILLATAPHKSQTFCIFDSPNFLMSEDPWLGKYTLLWFKYIISSSSQLSKINMGLRNEVLAKFIRDIQNSKEKVLKWLE